jgi:hypothetical protein
VVEFDVLRFDAFVSNPHKLFTSEKNLFGATIRGTTCDFPLSSLEIFPSFSSPSGCTAMVDNPKLFMVAVDIWKSFLFPNGDFHATTKMKIWSATQYHFFCLSLCSLFFKSKVYSFLTSSDSLSRRSTQLCATQSLGGNANALPTRANELIDTLWGSKNGIVNINRIVSACSETIVWEDMRLKKMVQGKDAAFKLLSKQIPRGTSIILDKVSDGAKSAGFTWTRECNGKSGLRGTTYVLLNDEGKIECVKELAEPLLKPGEMMLKLLQATTKNISRPKKNPTYIEETPTKCSDIVDYIWNRAYPKDAPIGEAIKFYSDKIIYQDFNYPEPIVGGVDVENFSREWRELPGIEFRIQDLSEGDIACCFTWRVQVNGKEGPQG